MTNEQLKQLENDLWDSANRLRATGGIKSADYAVPVLGIIFLRFADNKYAAQEAEIKKEFDENKGTRSEIAIEKIAVRKCGLYLSSSSRYDHLLNLKSSDSLAKAIKEAMEDIEKHQDEKFKDILPKDAYAEIEKVSAELLPDLLKTFSDIPKDASGDVFGKIYEYFLGKFALSEGQKGGEFFTPTSVVRFIVESIEPYSGKIYDPACGSGGMFVQSANFLEKTKHNREDISVFGQENEQATVKLAKMNLLVNNLRGDIKKANSYEDNPYDSKGKFDFVMANPPFNVKGVKETTVKNDSRFTHYGLPKNKGKKDDKITDANYLWISLFATSLNKTGKAGFVMPNSASDAGNSEYEIRKKIVDSSIVDVMVSIPSNMFFTVTLPATLWFFDNAKVKTPRKDKILFIDAKHTYKQIDRAHREWSEENIQNLSSIVRLYHGEDERYLELVSTYISNAQSSLLNIDNIFQTYQDEYNALIERLSKYKKESESKRKDEQKEKLNASTLLEKLKLLKIEPKLKLPHTQSISSFDAKVQNNDKQKEFALAVKDVVEVYNLILKELTEKYHALVDIFKQSDKLLKVKADKNWSVSNLPKSDKSLENSFTVLKEKLDSINYWYDNINWLQEKFPDAKYTDVVGLCRVADREEYVAENDYSLNAGRYVGVALEDDKLTEEEFKEMLSLSKLSFQSLLKESHQLESNIVKNIEELINA